MIIIKWQIMVLFLFDHFFTRFVFIFFQGGKTVQIFLDSSKVRIPAKYWSKMPITLNQSYAL